MPRGRTRCMIPKAGAIDSSPAIAVDGTVYFGSLNSNLYALQSTSLGLADSPWPTMQHDNQRTGRVGGGSPAAPAEINYPGSVDGDFSVSWSAVANAKTYMLQRSITNTFEEYSTSILTDTAFMVTGLLSGIYYYRVRAANDWGVSPWTAGDAITVTNVPCDLPAKPESITYPTNSNSGVFEVSWFETIGADAYTAERATSGDFSSPGQVYESGSETKFTENVASGTYYYRVRAENACGWSDFSDHGGSIVVCIPPAAPASITYPTSSSTGSFTVSWAQVSDATSYVVERSTNSSFSPTSQVYSGNSTSYSQTGLGSGTYYYRVRAVNCGLSEWENGSEVTVCIPPAAPASITYPTSNSTGSFTVSWAQVSNATSYVVERSTSSSFNSPTRVYSGSENSFSQTGLGSGTYYYRVQAVNSCGSGEWRNGSGVSVTRSSKGGGGCTLGPNASPGLEWLLLILLGMGLCWRRIDKEKR
jgi:hypothetical protein